MSEHEERISEIEEFLKEIEDQISQQQGTAKIDYSLICSKDQYLSLYEQTKDIQKKQLTLESGIGSNE